MYCVQPISYRYTQYGVKYISAWSLIDISQQDAYFLNLINYYYCMGNGQPSQNVSGVV